MYRSIPSYSHEVPHSHEGDMASEEKKRRLDGKRKSVGGSAKA